MTDGFRPTVVEQAPVAFQTHGLGVHLTFDEHGLSPYWGTVSVYEPDHDETLDDLDALGDTWEIAETKHWEGQLASPDGAEFDGGLNEYQYQLVADDEAGDRDLTIQLRPGFPDAENVHSGEPIQGIPDDCPESLRVQVMATNLDVDEILPLLQAWADHVGLNPDYFETPHEYSSVYQLERYARLGREVAEAQLTGDGGLLDQLADFSSSQSGRGMYKWDHEDVQAHYEAVAFDPETWSLLIPEQRLGKQLKCYHPRHVRDAGSDDPLADPKVEISLSSEYDPDGTVPWEDIDVALGDLDEAVYNVLNWADVPVQPDPDVWNTDDPYFDVGTADESVTLHANPLPELREATEKHVESELVRQDLTETDQQIVQALTDGGPQHYEELAEKTETSSSTVYRLLQRLPSLLDSDNGVIDFADEITRRNVAEIVDQVRETASWARDSLRSVVGREAALSGAAEPSALERWMNRHGIELVQDSAALRFKLRRSCSKRELAKIIRSGLRAAEASGLESDFREATISWTDLDGQSRPDWQLYVNGRVLGRYLPSSLH